MNQKPARKVSKMMIALRVVKSFISISVGAVVILCFAVAPFYFGPGRFERDRMNAIVDVVRQQQIDPERGTQFQIDDFANPKDLRVTDPGPGNVWAKRTPDGELVVSIMTKDRGHCGEYGFTYSDIPLKAKKIEDEVYLVGVTGRGQELFAPGGMYEPRGKVDDHWWKVCNPTR